MFSATMDEYQNFGLYADLLTDDPAKFRSVYNALAGSTGKVDALRYNYSSQLLDYSQSVRGADGWALIGTFGGDIGFVVDATRRVASGGFSDVAQEIAIGYALGKVLVGASWGAGKLLGSGNGVKPLVDQAVPPPHVPDQVPPPAGKPVNGAVDPGLEGGAGNGQAAGNSVEELPRNIRENPSVRDEVLNGSKVHGLDEGQARAATSGMRGGGGHAIRKLEGLFISNAGSLQSRVDAFTEIAIPILMNPVHQAPYRLSQTQGQAFLGNVSGVDLVIIVARDGPHAGKVISAFVPDANQKSIILSR